jgi:DHA1 family multidrug resistance protein-like MFS transporter
MGFTFGIIGFFIIPETHSGRILQKRAKTLKYQTKNWALHAKVDEREVDFHDLVFVCFLRPFHMLFREPILFLITVYMSIVYGILYLFFSAYPISFQEKRGWNGGVGALPFIGIGVGVLLGCFTIVYMTKTRFARKLKKHGLIPEERLPAMMAGAVILPAGLFWFAWTSSVEISWVPQAIAGVPIGMGILMIFLQGLNYIIDVYLMNANSAIAANTFLRSFAGAGFPLFASYMYNSLGVNWATSTLGFACAALVPVPFAFFHWGAKLRSMSKFSPY